jgi:flavin-dependent dehydrogenase
VVEVLRKLDPTIISELVSSPIQCASWGVTFVAPNGKALEIPFKKDYRNRKLDPPGFISKRLDFDHFMIEKATERGVEVLEGFDAQDFIRKEGGWEILSAEGQRIEARMLIIANGAHSRFARQAGIEKENRHYCAGVRAYFRGVEYAHPGQFIELHFSRSLLPGYFWIFPLPGGLFNVGVGMRSDKVSKKKIHLRERMMQMIREDKKLQERFARAEIVGKIEGYGLPLGSKKRRISGEGYLLTGDAAALIDPFTGEGIGNAMVSGVEAGKVAAEAMRSGRCDAGFLQRYDAHVYKRLGRELQLSYKMQQLVNYPWLFNLVVNRALKSETLRSTISAMFEDIDLRSRLKKPGFYRDLLFK